MFKYKCERQGCTSYEKNIPCLKCANSFYCSIKCRNTDVDYHNEICNKTNTRDMIHVNACLIKILRPVLAEFNGRCGIINIRSYSYYSEFLHQDGPVSIQKYGDKLVVKLPIPVFITFIPLNVWSDQYHNSTVLNNDYSKRIIVNVHLEGMNKPQLYRLCGSVSRKY